jgi:hypothetical protein
MAVGDIKWFGQALLDLGKKVHDLSADTFRLGLVTSATTPTVGMNDPRWAAGGGTNLTTNQVPTGTSYTNGGPTLVDTWTLIGSTVPTFRADVVTINQDASGFTTARWGIIYNNTDASKRAIAFIDLGSDRSIVSGSLTLDWSGATNDVLTITQS